MAEERRLTEAEYTLRAAVAAARGIPARPGGAEPCEPGAAEPRRRQRAGSWVRRLVPWRPD
ncbi:MAG TPA: hypothetical protein VKA55_09115 [Gammaproteobacteria bacterium]|nr:hypothetical protein [Gammaproteobacteria bacterium]